MTIEIEKEIAKMQYQIDLLARTIDYKAYPIENLVLSLDWSSSDLEKAHDIFEKWDKVLDAAGKVDHFDFESDFEDKLGVGYQTLKGVVNAFYRNGQWTDVCEAFVDSMGDNPSVEYLAIKRRERDDLI